LVTAAAELATEVLGKLRSVKRNYIRIRDPDVLVYKDRSLSTLHDTGGVMVAQLDNDGEVLHIAVYPRSQEYVKGRFVSWEWDLGRVFESEGWYHDSEANGPKLAWSSSSTFGGREYPQQWGLEYRFARPDRGLD
jgi:hypothetical protein